ncbi:MAG TPA: hypothetical protein VFG72_04175 [Marmoricola sp.]|nr:hypothetical protein [Marmoricola sp.]
MTTATRELLDGLCDDAALFPPGNLPLVDAVPAHVGHLASDHRALVGPFIVSAADVGALGPLLAEVDLFEVAVTVPSPDRLPAALADAAGVPAVRVVAVEVAVPVGVDASQVVPVLDAAVAEHPGLEVYVELPRDERRPALLATLVGTRYHAKLRTGGVRADLYPDEHELAAAVVACVAAGVAFKATAGLHHAVRNTDPSTGFEQHGFLNVLAAVDAARGGATVDEVAELLAERDARTVAAWVADLDGSVRAAFRSFGTCSIDDPRDELTALGLLDRIPHTTDQGARSW